LTFSYIKHRLTNNNHDNNNSNNYNNSDPYNNNDDDIDRSENDSKTDTVNGNDYSYCNITIPVTMSCFLNNSSVCNDLFWHHVHTDSIVFVVV
jgi:hypothetical protein